MMNIEDLEPTVATVERAAEWSWKIHESDVTDETILAWQNWLNASEMNRKAFADIDFALGLVGLTDNPALPGEGELLRDSYDGSVPVSEWIAGKKRALAGTPSTGRRSRLDAVKPRHWVVAASTVLLLATALLTMRIEFSRQHDEGRQTHYAIHETQTAEHRDVVLPDGSTISLGGKSTISAAYSATSRVIILQQGEAFFDIAKDMDRPFVVKAGNRRIVAVGTAFNVTRRNDRVEVMVTEGTVTVTPDSPPGRTSAGPDTTYVARLEAGHQMIYDESAASDVMDADAADVTAWRKGMLKYKGESLQYVVEDLNRYVQRPIRLADESVSELLYTGTVSQKNIDSWLAGMEKVFPVVIEDSPTAIIIHYKQ